jgi:hypothetical protein
LTPEAQPDKTAMKERSKRSFFMKFSDQKIKEAVKVGL